MFLGNSDYKLLKHHAKRVGKTMVSITRDALQEKLKQLTVEEEELDRKLGKRSRGIARVPDVITHRDGKRPTLAVNDEIRKQEKAATNPGLGPQLFKLPEILKRQKLDDSVPEKLRKNFSKWAAHIEGAKSKDEQTKREKEVVMDIHDLTQSDSEIRACVEALQAFLEERASSRKASAKKTKTAEVLDLSKLEIVGGDVDDLDEEADED